MKKNLLLIIIFCVQVFVLAQWLNCKELSSQFHYSSFDLQLRLIEGIHNDRDIPIWVVRLFHNKVIGTGLDTVNAYLQFWNVLFLASFVSLAGLVGLCAQFYYFLFSKKKQVGMWLLFAVVLLAPLLELFQLGSSFPYRLLVIGLVFIFWSLLGYRNLLQTKKVQLKFIVGILLLSLWYHFGLGTLVLFCALHP